MYNFPNIETDEFRPNYQIDNFIEMFNGNYSNYDFKLVNLNSIQSTVQHIVLQKTNNNGDVYQINVMSVFNSNNVYPLKIKKLLCSKRSHKIHNKTHLFDFLIFYINTNEFKEILNEEPILDYYGYKEYKGQWVKLEK